MPVLSGGGGSSSTRDPNATTAPQRMASTLSGIDVHRDALWVSGMVRYGMDVLFHPYATGFRVHLQGREKRATRYTLGRL